MAEQVTDQSCFVCGASNPISLGLRFTLEADRVVAEFASRPEHQGYDGVTHGGIIYSVLDDAMANWIWLHGEQGFTGRCEIRYRRQMPIGARVRVEGWQESRRGRLALLAGRVVDRDDGGVVAEANARFMIEGPRGHDWQPDGAG